MTVPNRNFSSPSYRYGFNGMEKDDNIKGNNNSYDFGARFYDNRIGRFLTLDAEFKSYPELSDYHFVRNNPILRIDPTGNWDIEIHAYKDRAKYGYGIAIVKDRKGNIIKRMTVRLNGQHRDRTKGDGDTPTGLYDIPNSDEGWAAWGDKRAYGPQARLVMLAEGGEANDVITDGVRDDWIRLHGGRQVHERDIDEAEPLKTTLGCVRCFDIDISDLKTLTDNLENDDPLEYKGKVTIIDDLMKIDGQYYEPSKASQIKVDKINKRLGESVTAKMSQEIIGGWVELLGKTMHQRDVYKKKDEPYEQPRTESNEDEIEYNYKKSKNE